MYFRYLLILFFITQQGFSQFYSNGQNSSSVNWRQINTEDFQIIFPADFGEKAQELANIIVYANKQSREYLKSSPRKISIIIQNNTTVDNGFVTLAPWRSEFYTMPSQENDGVRWLKKLAVHEYRHIVQLGKFQEGVGRVLYLLLGDQGLGALTILTTPLWFIEGDAVSIETRKTKIGRGDYGPFLRELKAQIIEGDSLSYEKASFGSYKEYVTDHYKLGYQMVEFVKAKFGEAVWDSVLTSVSHNPFIPYPFSYYLKKYTEKTTSEIYSDLYLYLKEKWKQKRFTERKTISSIPKQYASYSNPVLDYEGRVYCFKQSYDQIVRIILLDSLREKVIHVPGRIDLNNFSFGGGKLLWAEKRRDPRWQYRDYSELIIFDINLKNRKRIKRKTKWFGGALNKTGKTITLIEQSKSNIASVLIIDLNGNEINRFILDNGTAFHPAWYHQGVLFVKLVNEKSYLLNWSLANNTIDTLLQTNYPISYPKVSEKGILLQASISGKDKIVVVKNKQIYNVITPEFGLDFPAPYLGKVYYSDYHNNGMRISKSKIRIGEVINEIQEFKVLPEIDSLKFEVKKYYPLLHLFNPHSWAPISIYPDNQEVKLGLSLFSQNKLSSSALSLNYDYDWIQNSQELKSSYEFSHFYPVFFVDYSKSFFPKAIIQNVRTNFEEENISGGVRFSWLFDNNKYIKNLFLQSAYANSVLKYDFDETFADTTYSSENIQLLFYYRSSYRKAKKNIYSKWSFTVQGRYFSNLKNKQTSLMGQISTTVPGLFKNHGLRMSYSDQRSNSIFIPNFISESRGYLNYFYQDAQKISFDYTLPLLYPDFKIGKVAYVQRFRMSIFYDYMKINNGLINRELSSLGVELNMDFNPFRYSYLTQFGVEVACNNSGDVFLSPIFRILY